VSLFERQCIRSPRFISTSIEGANHDHSCCPLQLDWSDKVHHLATPLNLRNTGRKINIGGEGEAAYLGFEDYVIAPVVLDGNLGRPFTSELSDSCAGDICVRFAPINETMIKEIFRIAQSGCRLTVALPHAAAFLATPYLFSIGVPIEWLLLSLNDVSITALIFEIRK
jgi:hypothetical protein